MSMVVNLSLVDKVDQKRARKKPFSVSRRQHETVAPDRDPRRSTADPPQADDQGGRVGVLRHGGTEPQHPDLLRPERVR